MVPPARRRRRARHGGGAPTCGWAAVALAVLASAVAFVGAAPQNMAGAINRGGVQRRLDGAACSSSTFPACLPPSDADADATAAPAWPTQDAIDAFAATVSGDVAQPGTAGYSLFSFNARTHTPRPALVVFAEDTADVQQAVAFARAAGMRLSVSSTGHHQDVRNIADNALHLDMQRMDSVEIDVAAKTARVGTGAVFSAIARAAGEASGGTLVVASGSDSSVGPYGWTVGGGYGRLTRTHGLGVDLVRSFEVVLANGTVVTASADSNTDLFWAMRGSGGHPFGVTTSLTLQLVDDPGQTNDYVLTGELTTANAAVFADWALGAPDNAGAFFVTSMAQSSDGSSAAASAGADVLPDVPLVIAAYCFGTTADCDAVLEPLSSSIHCLPGVGQGNCTSVLRYPTYLDFQLEQPTFHGDGSAIAISSAALDAAAVGAGALENITAWVLSFEKEFGGQFNGVVGTGCFLNLVLGGASAGNDPGGALTSTAPAMRQSIVQVTCHVDWTRASPDAQAIMQKFDAWADSELQALSTDGWMYWNEPQHKVQDWQQRYWTQSAYDRMLGVKRAVDPDGFFVCYHCVGSEQIEDAGACPDTSCRCSNVAVGSCSVDPHLAVDCVDAPVYATLVAGPEFFGVVSGWIASGEMAAWANCSHLGGMLGYQLVVSGDATGDVCADVAGFAVACPAYCGLCGASVDSGPDFVFIGVAVAIVLAVVVCGVVFAVWAARTRQRRDQDKLILHDGRDGYRRRTESSVVEDYRVMSARFSQRGGRDDAGHEGEDVAQRSAML